MNANMKYCYLLLLSFAIFSSYFFEISHSNDLGYVVVIKNQYADGRRLFLSCLSDKEVLRQRHSPRQLVLGHKGSFLSWKFMPGNDNYDSPHRCFVSTKGKEADDEVGEESITEGFMLTIFDASWKLDEIIWETCTREDFIFSPKDESQPMGQYRWYLSEKGLSLYNYKRSRVALVKPNKNQVRDQVFVSNLFDDKRTISVSCKIESQVMNQHLSAVLHNKNDICWFIMDTEYNTETVHTCTVTWESEKATIPIQDVIFDAFKGSWKLDEILWEFYTREQFILNPLSQKHNYLWGVSEKGLSLYNFKTKNYEVLEANL